MKRRIYQVTEEFSTLWWKASESPVVLANFSAKIVGDRVVDDGAETRREFDIEATLDKGKRVEKTTVSAGAFAAMNWPHEGFGSAAVVNPNMRDHLRAAIQVLSPRISEKKVYGHTGWRSIGGTQVYLHGAGAIGERGEVKGIETELSPEISRFKLPAPPPHAKLRDAAAASVATLDLAGDELTVPLYCSIWRAAIGGATCSVFLSGLTGSGKSELAALAQQHFGPALHAKALPASWFSTPNALETLAFQAKDALLCIDDFVPTGSSGDVSRLHSIADRVLRSQGNLSTRQRMTADMRMRPSRPARGMILATGEDVPRGQSLRARLVVLDVGPAALDFGKLTGAQQAAAAGVYASHLSGFLKWIAPRLDSARELLHAELVKFRARQVDGHHRRTPDNIAQLAGALRVWLTFAVETKAIGDRAAEKLWTRCAAALDRVITAQEQQQESSDPVKRYIELLSSVIRTGRAHLASPSGGPPPENPQAWGWRGGQAQGQKIGWIDGEDLYLEPSAAYSAVRQFGFESGEAVALQQRTLHQRLSQRGVLATFDETRERLTVRRTLEGERHDVLHVLASSLISYDRPNRPNRPTAAAETFEMARLSHRPTDRPTATPRKEKTSAKVGRLGRSKVGGRVLEKKAWPLTLAAIDQMFPGQADEAFVEQLAAAVEGTPRDEEMSAAILPATRKKQESIGLYLRTVPAHLRWMRANKNPAAAPKPAGAVKVCGECSGSGIVGRTEVESLGQVRELLRDGAWLCRCSRGNFWAQLLPDTATKPA